MLNYYQQLVKQFNVRKQKPRYKAKRLRRAYLTEADLGGELALYKPVHIPYRLFSDKPLKEYADIHTETEIDSTGTYGDGGFDVTIDKNTVTFSPHVREKIERPIKLTWFDKLIMWIREIWNGYSI